MKRGAVTTVSESPVSEKPASLNPTKLSLSTQERETLVQEFLPVIKYMAMRMAMRASSGLNVEDLMSAGMVGLLDALTKFDPSREIKFRT
ncbi:MAG: hypothetical protein KC584_04790, partial [Nitrospira sp.]|nr:hypothetical protein [Nitrospira sp.]